ncbi:hypothetical protein BIW11_02724 [Tropilaelaps mercedesae]|uniref:Uncharacterized protein n=1 Tax=Tropilaelaps mercedesae TaxID=418985 RepID=A0A1V9XYG7_9ACAR|nr:hypothetical protein BIW11_02724 [Tropilaelaps mercedesae]
MTKPTAAPQDNRGTRTAWPHMRCYAAVAKSSSDLAEDLASSWQRRTAVTSTGLSGSPVSVHLHVVAGPVRLHEKVPYDFIQVGKLTSRVKPILSRAGDCSIDGKDEDILRGLSLALDSIWGSSTKVAVLYCEEMVY